MVLRCAIDVLGYEVKVDVFLRLTRCVFEVMQLVFGNVMDDITLILV